jgi:hypothetical protein
MRFSNSIAWTTARAAHESAYAAHNLFASAGDDGIKSGGSAEADAASAAEYAALNHLLLLPCDHPLDIAEKLTIVEQRDVTNWDVWDDVRARIDADLRAMARPSASPEMATAFARWAAARLIHFQPGMHDGTEEASEAASAAYSEAFQALHAEPCRTPGDFIIKAYTNLLDEVGSSTQVERGSPFEFDVYEPRMPDGSGHDDHAIKAQIRDIGETDLGRCMMILGRVDFDAAAWVATVRRAEAHVHVMLHVDGKQSLSFAMYTGPGYGRGIEHDSPLDNARLHNLLALTAGGLGYSDERLAAIADEIVANHPDMVVHTGTTSDHQLPVAEAAE